MLEIGKYYQQRNGVVIGPLTSWTPSEMFKDFIYRDPSIPRVWNKDGKFSLLSEDHENDLISEVEFKPLTEQPKEEIMSKPLKLEVGKYYEDREFTVYGPVEAHDHPIYSFTDGDLVWTENGNYYDIGDSDLDLIKEVPNPNQESETMPEQPAQSEPIQKFKEISLTEALEVLKSEQCVYITTQCQSRVLVVSGNSISLLLSATKFEIEDKPVVKYLVVYSDGWNTYITSNHFESIKAFYNDFDVSVYHQAELIQFTRKEF
jgi:hypothetical protein